MHDPFRPIPDAQRKTELCFAPLNPDDMKGKWLYAIALN